MLLCLNINRLLYKVIYVNIIIRSILLSKVQSHFFLYVCKLLPNHLLWINFFFTLNTQANSSLKLELLPCACMPPCASQDAVSELWHRIMARIFDVMPKLTFDLVDTKYTIILSC